MDDETVVTLCHLWAFLQTACSRHSSCHLPLDLWKMPRCCKVKTQLCTQHIKFTHKTKCNALSMKLAHCIRTYTMSIWIHVCDLLLSSKSPVVPQWWSISTKTMVIMSLLRAPIFWINTGGWDFTPGFVRVPLIWRPWGLGTCVTTDAISIGRIVISVGVVNWALLVGWGNPGGFRINRWCGWLTEYCLCSRAMVWPFVWSGRLEKTAVFHHIFVHLWHFYYCCNISIESDLQCMNSNENAQDRTDSADGWSYLPLTCRYEAEEERVLSIHHHRNSWKPGWPKSKFILYMYIGCTMMQGFLTKDSTHYQVFLHSFRSSSLCVMPYRKRVIYYILQ